MKKIDWILLVIVTSMLIIGMIIYPQLPEQVPMHWNAAGEIDGYGSPLEGAFGIPLINLAIFVLLLIVPRIDPRKDNYKKFTGVYNIVKVFMVLFMTLIYGMILAAAFNYQIQVGFVVKFALGLLFIILGNFFGKIRHNYFFGIRTPWTLANETVWNKTHRLAGPLWVAAGIVAIITAFFNHPATFGIFMGCVALTALIPSVYSYLLYRDIQKKND